MVDVSSQQNSMIPCSLVMAPMSLLCSSLHLWSSRVNIALFSWLLNELIFGLEKPTWQFYTQHFVIGFNFRFILMTHRKIVSTSGTSGSLLLLVMESKLTKTCIFCIVSCRHQGGLCPICLCAVMVSYWFLLLYEHHKHILLEGRCALSNCPTGVCFELIL